jgi:hypothetical protein
MAPTKSFPRVVLMVALALAAAGAGARAADDTAVVPPARTAQAIELRLMEFRPKLSPDTLLDYRPILADRVAALPPAQLSLLGDLVAMLEALKERAMTKPGGWRVGAVYLGANAQEYRPSDDELLAAELGDRIRRIVGTAAREDVAGALQRAGVRAALVEYNRFEYRHADVMGSGRFFYASEPKATAIRLADQ